MIVASSRSMLKDLAIEREHSSTQSNFQISFEVEYTLSKLLTEEIDFIKTLQVINTKLTNRYDFNAVSLFAVLDNNQVGQIKMEK